MFPKRKISDPHQSKNDMILHGFISILKTNFRKLVFSPISLFNLISLPIRRFAARLKSWPDTNAWAYITLSFISTSASIFTSKILLSEFTYRMNFLLLACQVKKFSSHAEHCGNHFILLFWTHKFH
jgi:hypothetical protein